MCRSARGLSGIGRDDHWQFAEYSIPPREPIRASCSLQYFLQDRRRKPDRLSVFESVGEPFDFDVILAA